MVKEDVMQYVNSFINIWKTYEAIFSETHILKNPDYYLLDRNHQERLANGIKNFDWMYMYHLPMNTKVMNGLAK